jgi:sulfur carrier protein ThiS adenylyltransferase
MWIKYNERKIEVKKGITVYGIKKRYKPAADVIIYNGAPLDQDVPLRNADEVVLIKRGEIPSKRELEVLMVARHTPGVHEKVKECTVGIAGAGGVGSVVAIALARIGIGRIIIADNDVVEPSNLNRQQFFIDQLGQPKVKAIKDNLKRINPYVRVVTHRRRLTKKNIPGIFRKVDVLIEAFDTADQKELIISVVTKSLPRIPLVFVSGLAGYGANNTIKTRKVGKNLYVVGDLKSSARPGCGLMAPRVGIAASHAANAALRIILGDDPSK